jgi:hypothetical protein
VPANVEITVKDDTADAPAWLTETDLPATLIVPVLAVEVGFAATVYSTEPLPLPLAPAVIEIQVADVVAVQLQPLAVDIVIRREPPPLGTDSLAGETVYSQAGTPACVTV